MWQKILDLFRRPAHEHTLLTEFEGSLMLIVDPEQLTNNMLSKLNELAEVEKAFVYLADRSESSHDFTLADKTDQLASRLPNLTGSSVIIQWFRTNREILVFAENEEVTDYLRPELEPFLKLDINLAHCASGKKTSLCWWGIFSNGLLHRWGLNNRISLKVPSSSSWLTNGLEA